MSSGAEEELRLSCECSLFLSYISELAERVIILTSMKLIMIMVLNYGMVTLQLCVISKALYG